MSSTPSCSLITTLEGLEVFFTSLAHQGIWLLREATSTRQPRTGQGTGFQGFTFPPLQLGSGVILQTNM